MRILLAEDDALWGTRLQMLLELAGHAVTRVSSGAQAFRAFQSEPFPVVVTNLTLRDLHGFDLCRHIRSRTAPEYVYVILLVPPGVAFQFEDATEADADDVLALPVEPNILRARLRVAERMLNLYEELDRLRGFIPICAYCKKIRQDQGLWQQMEAYISAHSHALFSHTICPECAEREFGEVLKARPPAGEPGASG